MENPFEKLDQRLYRLEALLLELKSQPQQSITHDKDELLTVEETAKFLSLSVPTIYSLISRGELPAMKRSKRCYFSKVELIAYLKAGRKMTHKEFQQKAIDFVSGKNKGGSHV